MRQTKTYLSHEKLRLNKSNYRYICNQSENIILKKTTKRLIKLMQQSFHIPIFI